MENLRTAFLEAQELTRSTRDNHAERRTPVRFDTLKALVEAARIVLDSENAAPSDQPVVMADPRADIPNVCRFCTEYEGQAK
jgi:hypothetical protein